MSENTLKKPSNVAYYIRIIGTLFAITAIVALLLALVNMLTAPKIAQLAAETKTAAIREVMPTLTETSQQEELDVPEGMSAVDEIMEIKDGGATLGYCVQTTTAGHAGDITLMVGFDPNGTIQGVAILSQSETLYVEKQPELVAQFAGLSGTVGAGQVDAISNATHTSDGIIGGVNAAVAAADYYMRGGNGNG